MRCDMRRETPRGVDDRLTAGQGPPSRLHDVHDPRAPLLGYTSDDRATTDISPINSPQSSPQTGNGRSSRLHAALTYLPIYNSRQKQNLRRTALHRLVRFSACVSISSLCTLLFYYNSVCFFLSVVVPHYLCYPIRHPSRLLTFSRRYSSACALAPSTQSFDEFRLPGAHVSSRGALPLRPPPPLRPERPEQESSERERAVGCASTAPTDPTRPPFLSFHFSPFLSSSPFANFWRLAPCQSGAKERFYFHFCRSTIFWHKFVDPEDT